MILAGVLFLAWLVANFHDLTGDSDAIIRFVLGLLFAALIMFRWKQVRDRSFLPGWTVPVSLVVGTLSAIGGIVFHVHQFEWLGLIMILYACLPVTVLLLGFMIAGQLYPVVRIFISVGQLME